MRSRSKEAEAESLATEIDTTMYDLDPYGYIDACKSSDIELCQMRRTTRLRILEDLWRKDPGLLNGLRSVREGYVSEEGHSHTVKKFDRLIRRTERFFARR